MITSAARAEGPASRVLPTSVKAYAAVTDWPTFGKRWEASLFGKLLTQEGFKDIRNEANHAGLDAFGLGITAQDLSAAGAGEVSWAVVRLGPETAARFFIVDTKGNSEKAKTVLVQVNARLKSQGGTPASQDIAGIGVHTYKWPDRFVAMAQKGSMLIFSNSLPAMHEVLNSTGKGNLAGLPAFIETQKQAKARLKDAPDISWFIEPLGLLDTQRLSGRKLKARGPDMLHVLQKEGFEGIRGIGGVLRFGGGEELIAHVAVFAPKPHSKSMRMLAFPPAKDFAAPAWIPTQNAAYGTVCYDMKQGFENIAPLFDAVYGDNEQGTFDDVVKALRDDPDGPRVDIAKDIVARVGPRVTVVLDTSPSPMAGGGGALFAVEARDEKHVADAVRKLMKDDPEVQRHEVQGAELWEILEKKKTAKPNGTTAIETRSKGVLAVAKGQLMYCDDLCFIQKVLSGQANQGAPQPSVGPVSAVLKQYVTGQDSLLFVSRLAEEFNAPYETFRQGKDAGRQFLHGHMFHRIMGMIYQGDRSKLPSFDRLAPHLGLAGVVGSSTETGWIISGVILKKN